MLLTASVYEKLVLDIPELLRQVNVVSVGILKALYLLPKGVHLALAIALYLGDVGGGINALARLEDGDEKLARGVVGNRLFLPGLNGIK